MTESSAPVALITGAGRGIGRHLCEHLLRRGYLVVGCSRSPADWHADGFTHLQADVAVEDQVKPVFRHIRERYGRLDAVVNNAGTASMNHVLLTPVSTVERILRTNVVGTFLVSREAAKLMYRRHFGRIVNIGSAIEPLRLAGEAAYIASKSAIVGLSQVMARELSEFGITVNVVGPALVATEILRGVPPEKIQEAIRQLPIQRMSTPEEVAAAVEFFLRPESGGITGQVLYLGGGASR